MTATTAVPRERGTARCEDVPGPGPHDGSVLVEAVAPGACGTDVGIVSGEHGWAPPRQPRLTPGHASLGPVLDPGPSGSLMGKITDRQPRSQPGT